MSNKHNEGEQADVGVDLQPNGSGEEREEREALADSEEHQERDK